MTMHLQYRPALMALFVSLLTAMAATPFIGLEACEAASAGDAPASAPTIATATAAAVASAKRTANPPPSASATSIALGTYQGCSVEPGVVVTLKPSDGGAYKLGLVWDFKLGRPGVYFAGKKPLGFGINMVQTAAYTPWLDATDSHLRYALQQAFGVKWASTSGDGTLSVFLRQLPEGALPARQQPNRNGRIEAVVYGMTSGSSAGKSWKVWGSGAQEIGNTGEALMAGATVGSKVLPTATLSGSLTAGWSNRRREFTLDGGSSPFSVAGTTLSWYGDSTPLPRWAGNEAVAGSVALKFRFKPESRIAIPQVDAWAGPHIDFGWAGDRPANAERYAASLGIAAGLDMGPASDAMSFRVGVALPVLPYGSPRAYAYAMGPAF